MIDPRYEAAQAKAARKPVPGAVMWQRPRPIAWGGLFSAVIYGLGLIMILGALHGHRS